MYLRNIGLWYLSLWFCNIRMIVFSFPLADHYDSIFVPLATQLLEVLFSVLKVLFHTGWFISCFDKDDHLLFDSNDLVKDSLNESVIGFLQPLSFATS